MQLGPFFQASARRREIIIFLVCFGTAYILNVIGIMKEGAPVHELVTRLHLVLLIALVLYVASAVLRILYYLISRFWNWKR